MLKSSIKKRLLRRLDLLGLAIFFSALVAESFPVASLLKKIYRPAKDISPFIISLACLISYHCAEIKPIIFVRRTPQFKNSVFIGILLRFECFARRFFMTALKRLFRPTNCYSIRTLRENAHFPVFFHAICTVH